MQRNKEMEKIHQERKNNYGSFKVNAAISQKLKVAIQVTPKYKDLSTTQKEGLDMVCSKLSRLLTGDCNHRDSWIDMIGFLNLIVEEMDYAQGEGRSDVLV